VINCGSLTESLADSELFGYVKGAFTGAASDRAGLFESANHGIVFLDEIGELPAATQAKLLRVLQNKEVRPVGATRAKSVDFRLIAATNRDLKKRVDAGEFRADLYYRIAPIHIRIPPLRDRRDDVPELAAHILNKLQREYAKPLVRITDDVLPVLQAYSWPGNIRELENVLLHAAIMAEFGSISAAHLPEYLYSHMAEPRSAYSTPGEDRSLTCEPRRLLSLDEVARHHVRSVLAATQGRRAEAAAILGIGRTTLFRILKRTGPERRGGEEPIRKPVRRAQNSGQAGEYAIPSAM
jgi:transcriptional regulator with PAS, ATPase and Fis domain